MGGFRRLDEIERAMRVVVYVLIARVLCVE